MTGPAPTHPAPAAVASPARASLRTVWLLFAPPAVTLGLRWVLEGLAGRQTSLPALPLVPVSAPAGLRDLLGPLAVGLLVLVLSGLLVRRLGWRRTRPWAAAVWVLLWLAASGALVQKHLNQQGLFFRTSASMPGQGGAGPAPVTARVLARQFRPPSLRGAGGTQLVLQVPGLDVPQRLLIDDAQAASVQPGDTLALDLVRGRYAGLFVTGWHATLNPPPAPAVPASPRSSLR